MEHKPFYVFTFEPENQEPDIDPAPITKYEQETDAQGERVIKVRLDKWLWAARFFKTRPLARAAIEQGKILYIEQGEVLQAGQKTLPTKVLPTKEIQLGATLIINQGRNKKVVVIRGLSTRRRNLDEADALYEEVQGMCTQYTLPAFNSSTDDQSDCATKPRKTVRYLRRPMSTGDASNINRDYEQNDGNE